MMYLILCLFDSGGHFDVFEKKKKKKVPKGVRAASD